MNNRFVSWRRVSTFKQGRSGLGLEAQKEIIRYFIERDNGELIADYEECYTGKELGRCKELRKAMEHAKRERATLIIAKSDRFRNTAEALQIYEEMGDGNIMFCDLPTSDKFSLTLFFALAEREALLVSIRTKQALRALKERGTTKIGAANEKYQKTFNNKTMEEKQEIFNKRGKLKRERFLESPTVRAFIRVLKNVFPEQTLDDDISKWNWERINLKYDQRQQMLALVRDYKAIDPTLFRKFDGSEKDENTLRILWYSIKRSAITIKKRSV